MAALGLVFGFEVCFPLVAWAFGKPIGDLRDICTLVVTPTVTVIGTARGFYFSSRL